MTPKQLFRYLATAEAITWALLLLGMVLKYVTRTTELGVRVFGTAHGFVFVAYCVGVLAVAANQRWRAGTTLLGLLSAVPPFATIPFERWAERGNLLDGGWYSPADGERGPLPQRAVGWAAARPWLSLGLGMVAVVALFSIALMVGPPGGSSS